MARVEKLVQIERVKPRTGDLPACCCAPTVKEARLQGLTGARGARVAYERRFHPTRQRIASRQATDTIVLFDPATHELMPSSSDRILLLDDEAYLVSTYDVILLPSDFTHSGGGS
jgi:hypothetical protein